MKKREITFSRQFPSYHPNKGEPTYFVEAILTQIKIDYTSHDYLVWLIENNKGVSELFLESFFNSLSHDILPKKHTIRNHKRPINVGDYIIPKVWAGKPYNKTKEGFWQIVFAPPIEIVKTFDIEVHDNLCYTVNNKYWHEVFVDLYNTIAANDGLTFEQLCNWFNKPFIGKILCWDKNVNY